MLTIHRHINWHFGARCFRWGEPG